MVAGNSNPPTLGTRGTSIPASTEDCGDQYSGVWASNSADAGRKMCVRHRIVPQFGSSPRINVASGNEGSGCFSRSGPRIYGILGPPLVSAELQCESVFVQ